MAGFAQDIWLTRRVGAVLSKFGDTRGELTARSSTGQQSCETPAMMQTRKPAGWVHYHVACSRVSCCRTDPSSGRPGQWNRLISTMNAVYCSWAILPFIYHGLTTSLRESTIDYILGGQYLTSSNIRLNLEIECKESSWLRCRVENQIQRTEDLAAFDAC